MRLTALSDSLPLKPRSVSYLGCQDVVRRTGLYETIALSVSLPPNRDESLVRGVRTLAGGQARMRIRRVHRK